MQKTGFFLLAISATLISFYPLFYLTAYSKYGLLQSKSAELLSSPYWRAGFYMHITGGGIALLLGWSQFRGHLKNKFGALHRNIGKVYLIACCLSALAAIYISFYATGGVVPATGFFALGVVWLSTTLSAFWHIRNGRIEAHRNAMTYSYAACMAAVTLRIYLPLLRNATGDFIMAYSIVAWLCWVPNLVVAWYINRQRKPIALVVNADA